jgi:hypothetical protein
MKFLFRDAVSQNRTLTAQPAALQPSVAVDNMQLFPLFVNGL